VTSPDSLQATAKNPMIIMTNTNKTFFIKRLS
jgi:hypothetical protein